MGLLLIFFGFAFGEDLGSVLSRPLGADIWEISEGKIYACTFVPIVAGVYSLIISLKITFKKIDEKLNRDY